MGAWNRPELARLSGRLSSWLRTIGLAVRLTALLAGRLLVRADNKAVNSGAGVVELEAAGTVGGAVVHVGGEVGQEKRQLVCYRFLPLVLYGLQQ